MKIDLKRLAVVFGVVFFGLLSIAAVADVHQWQLPAGFYNAGVRLVGIDQSGNISTAGTITSTGKTTIDSLYVPGASEFDGGSKFDHTLTTLGKATLDSAYAPGTLGTDGGLQAKNSIIGPTLTDSAGAATLSGTLAVTSTITALAGSRVMVATAQAAANDNSWQFYVGAVGTAITFSPAFSSGTPHCFCNDLTASQFCRVTATSTTATITGTGTDSVFVGCVGIK